MKKLKLKALSLGAREILSREQLRSITGGSCASADGCAINEYCDESDNCVPLEGGYSGSGAGGGSGSGSQMECYCQTFCCGNVYYGMVDTLEECNNACGV